MKFRTSKTVASESSAEVLQSAIPTTGASWKTLVRLQRVLRKAELKQNPASKWLEIILWIYSIAGLLWIIPFFDSLEKPENYSGIAAIFATGSFCFLVVMIMLDNSTSMVYPTTIPMIPLKVEDFLKSSLHGMFFGSRGLLVLVVTTLSTMTIVLVAPSFSLGLLAILIAAALLSIVLTILMGNIIGEVIGIEVRTSKDRLSKFMGAATFIVIIGFNMVVNYDIGSQSLSAMGNIMQYTPFAAPSGIIVHYLLGNPLGLLICLAISIFSIGVLYFVHLWFLKQEVKEPTTIKPAVHKETKVISKNELVQPERLLIPGLRWSPLSVIFSRGIRYFKRDSRLSSVVFMLPIFIIFVVFQVSTKGPGYAVFGTGLVALICSVQGINDHGADGPGLGLHLLSGVKTKTLVSGRNLVSLALSLAAITLTVVACVIGMLIMHIPSGIIATTIIQAFAVGIGVALSISAVAVVLAVNNPFPTAPPGTNPWKDRSGYRAGAMVSGLLGTFLGWLPIVPGGIMVILGVTLGRAWLEYLGLGIILLIPVILYIVAQYLASKKMDLSAPEIYQKVRVFVSS